MSRRRTAPAELRVEELDVGAWGRHDDWQPPGGLPSGPPMAGPPPGPPPRQGVADPPAGPTPGTGWSEPSEPWWRRYANQLVAGAGAFLLLVVVVSVSAGGGDPGAAPTTPPPTTVPRSTTEPRPVETPAPSTTAPSPANGASGTPETAADDGDFRFALTDLPEGFEVTYAALLGETEVWAGTAPGSTLFVGDLATWTDGPWLLVTGSDADVNPWTFFPFRRPPTAYSIGDTEVQTGESNGGVEVTVLRRGSALVEIAGRGLDPLATIAVAEHVHTSGRGIAVPDAAIPGQLRSQPFGGLPEWLWGQSEGTRAHLSLQGLDQQSGMGFSVAPAAEDSSWMDDASFFLDDLRYLSIRGQPGVAGIFTGPGADPTPLVRWRRDDHDYMATGYDVGLDELIAAAASVVQAGDAEWRAERWDDAEAAARQCCTQAPDVASAFADVVTANAGDADWRTQAMVIGDEVHWNLVSPRLGTGLGAFTPLQVPTLQASSGYQWDSSEFTAYAVALVDRSMLGATLRLTTTGSTAQTVELSLQPVDDGAGSRLAAAAAVLPWTDGGFVAQLVGPDGRTIAMQSDLDLP